MQKVLLESLCATQNWSIHHSNHFDDLKIQKSDYNLQLSEDLDELVCVRLQKDILLSLHMKSPQNPTWPTVGSFITN